MSKFDARTKRERQNSAVEQLKSSGVAISRRNIRQLNARFARENQSLLSEASREREVLRMKAFYTRKKWQWPPRQHWILTTVHLINGYYGKELVKHVPKDELETKLGL